MSDTQFSDLDRFILSLGWHYDPDYEGFVDSAEQKVEWHDVLAAVPHLSLSGLEAYTERKQWER